MKFLLSLTILLCIHLLGYAQTGKLMLVGGGAESDASNSWSDAPYTWAVEQGANKKVAIISYQSPSSPGFLPDYFRDLGAVDAQNIVIDSLIVVFSPLLTLFQHIFS